MTSVNVSTSSLRRHVPAGYIHHMKHVHVYSLVQEYVTLNSKYWSEQSVDLDRQLL